MDAQFVATTSDGNTYVEGKDFRVEPGLRKPWMQMVEKLQADGAFITSLRINIGKRTIVMPSANTKFGGFPPRYYSLQYHVHVDDVLGARDEFVFVDVAAHYENFAVHHIIDTSDGNTSWVTVTDNDALAPSPDRLASTSEDTGTSTPE